MNHQENHQENESCPTWYRLNSFGKCNCGSELGRKIICMAHKRVKLRTDCCMTHDNISQVTVVSSCPYSNNINNINDVFVQQPLDVNELNMFTCSRLKRRGLLCSHCEDSLGVAVLSYGYECTECLGNFKGWLVYITLALMPITVFYLIVVFCNIHATAPHMNALICVTQIIIYNVNSHPAAVLLSKYRLAIASLTIAGIWNLDFFRYLTPPFCISVDFTVLQVLAFEYIIAFYPLFLIIITYICIELHDKNYRVIVLLWKPFAWFFSHAQKCISFNLKEVKYSIINTFASFLILSYCKILFTCYNLLAITQVFRSDGSIFQGIPGYREYSLYNASIPYLGPQHKSYFITAMIILILFNVLPMLLLFVYPTKAFQKILGYFPRFPWHFLHAFVDAFQGCYKDGTNCTRDYRYFAGIYLFIRFVARLNSIFYSSYVNIFSFLSLLIASLLFGTLRPYKKDQFNRLDCFYFGLLAFGYFWYISGLRIALLPNFAVIYVITLIPVVHTFIIFPYHIFSLLTL